MLNETSPSEKSLHQMRKRCRGHVRPHFAQVRSPLLVLSFAIIGLGANGCGTENDVGEPGPGGGIETTSGAVCFDTSAPSDCSGARLWPGGVVSYSWAADFTNVASQNAIVTAMNKWTNMTSGVISFQKVGSGSTTPHIQITGVNGAGGLTDLGAPASGVSSGRMVGSIDANGQPAGSSNNAEHELGHAIGFFHHFMRNDRNRYITFRTTYSSWDNVKNVPAGTLCPSNELIGSGYGDPVNWFHCNPDDPATTPQMIGPFSFRSVMEYPSHELLDAEDTTFDTYKATGRVEGGNSGWNLQPEDADAAIQMYAGYGVFRPLDRQSNGSTDGVPRDYKIASGVTFNSATGSSPALDSWDVGHIDIYARGSDNKLYQKYNTSAGVYSDWILLDSNMGSSPSAVSWGWGRSDIAAVSTNGNVVVKSYSSGWQPWTSIGKPPVGVASGSSPSISSWGPSRLDVFVRGTDKKLYVSSCLSGTCLSSSSFTAWNVVVGSGTFLTNPAAISRASGIIDVFVQGTDHAIWQVEFNGGWGSWTKIAGGTVASSSSPSVASTIGAPLDLYVVGTDQRVWRNSWDGSSWSGYGVLGGTVASNDSVAAVGKTNGSNTEVHIAAPILGVTATKAPKEGVGVWLRAWPATAW